MACAEVYFLCQTGATPAGDWHFYCPRQAGDRKPQADVLLGFREWARGGAVAQILGGFRLAATLL
jgi:hypothetical protein